MIENQKIRPAKVIGPLGEPLTLDSLPPPSTQLALRGADDDEMSDALSLGDLDGPLRFPSGAVPPIETGPEHTARCYRTELSLDDPV